MYNENDRDLVFSESVKAGKRIYYFDVKKSRNGERYIAITESKKIVEGTLENQRVSFEKHKLFLYKEDYDKFMSALIKTLGVAREGDAPAHHEYQELDSAEPTILNSEEADADPIVKTDDFDMDF